MSYLLIHLAKDLRLEWRSKDAINGMLFFALLVVVLFSLAFDPTAALSRQIAGGILCVATLFAAVTALNQAWTRELRHQVLLVVACLLGSGQRLRRPQVSYHRQFQVLPPALQASVRQNFLISSASNAGSSMAAK